jgi:hypothetical protein
MSIEEDLERALDVEPSPAFVARVRQLVAQTPIAAVWWRSWQVAAVSAGVAVLVVVLAARSLPTEETPTAAGRDVPLVASVEPEPPSEVPVSPDVTSALPAPVAPPERPLETTRPATPDVLVAVGVQRDVEALRRFVNMVGDGRYTTVQLEDRVVSSQAALSVEVIDVEPLAVAPLAAIVPLEGDL